MAGICFCVFVIYLAPAIKHTHVASYFDKQSRCQMNRDSAYTYLLLLSLLYVFETFDILLILLVCGSHHFGAAILLFVEEGLRMFLFIFLFF